MATDIVFFGEIMLVVDFTDDLFDDILDRNEARDTAVFVHHHGEVIASFAELAQQNVETLALRHKGHWPHDVADVEGEAGLGQ